VGQYQVQATLVRERLASAKARLARMSANAETESYRDEIRRAEAYANDQIAADAALEKWGRRAPAPESYETRRAYRNRLAKIARKYLPIDHELKQVRIDDCVDPKVRKLFFDQIMTACRDAVYCGDGVAPGQLREVVEHDVNGFRRTSFVGDCEGRTFIDHFPSSSRRVTAFGIGRDGEMKKVSDIWPR
jgi:hypothetical protein